MEEKHFEDLEPSVQVLVRASEEIMERAYNRYSHFQVGAALQLSDGSVIVGCNVENSSFGLTICAERTALVRAIAEGKSLGKTTLEAVAVSAITNAALITPCGACRQFIGEFNPNVTLYLHNPSTRVVGITNLNYLLPGCFDFEAERDHPLSRLNENSI